LVGKIVDPNHLSAEESGSCRRRLGPAAQERELRTKLSANQVLQLTRIALRFTPAGEKDVNARLRPFVHAFYPPSQKTTGMPVDECKKIS
jgi:hypothetical protein